MLTASRGQLHVLEVQQYVRNELKKVFAAVCGGNAAVKMEYNSRGGGCRLVW